MTDVQHLLASLIESGPSAAAYTHFDRILTDARAGGSEAVLRAYTAVARLSSPMLIAGGTRAAWAAAFPGLDIDRWTNVDVMRAMLLLARPDAAVDCYGAADAAEQQSWLRGVVVLPSPGQYLPQVTDACRTNVLPVFCAVACGNPYPAAHFPELNFNQMVLKALFNGVPLNTITGLAGRRNPDLARMASDYADERRAAGRSVPEDIGLAL